MSARKLWTFNVTVSPDGITGSMTSPDGAHVYTYRFATVRDAAEFLAGRSGVRS